MYDVDIQLELTGIDANATCAAEAADNDGYFLSTRVSSNPIRCVITFDGSKLTLRAGIYGQAFDDYLCDWLEEIEITGNVDLPLPTLTEVPFKAQELPPIQSDSSCTIWSDVTLDDVGKTMCVYGKVRTSWYSEQQMAHIIIFSADPSAIYFVMDGPWTFDSLDDQCVNTTGKITRVGNTPLILMPSGSSIGICEN